MSTTFLEVDNISNSETGTSEVTTLLLNPSPLLSTAETTGNTVTDNLLLTVDDHLSRQLTTPLVQLIIGQLRPDGTGTESVDLLVGIRDVADQVITGGNKGNRVINHVGSLGVFYSAKDNAFYLLGNEDSTVFFRTAKFYKP